MKKIIFKSLQLCSFKEQKAKKITLHPERNLILGQNDTGKSCLMKSFYFALGANAKFEEAWLSADVKTLLNFEYDGTDIFILRDGKIFSLFDGEFNHIATFNSITSGLGPYLANLLGFGLKLLTKDSTDDLGTTPTPAYMFLPFYIDQDKGWSKSFDSFEGLKQFKDYRNPTIHYHTGIRPNGYYETKVEIALCNQKISDLQKDVDVVSRILEATRNKYANSAFSLDVEFYKKEVEELLIKIGDLTESETNFKNEMRELYDEKYVADNQLLAVNSALKILQSDFNFITENAEHGEISCPTCNTSFLNDFSSRLDIACDIHEFDQLKSELQSQLSSLSGQIEQTKSSLAPIRSSINNTSNVLVDHKRQIELEDIIRSEGRKEIISEITSDRDSIYTKIGLFNGQLSALQEKLKSFEDKKKQKEISNFYFEKIKKYLGILDVQNISEKKYKSITSIIEKSGSDKPRALLAYFLAIVDTINKHSTFFSSPIVIDSPNQQAQDQEHLTKILELIRDNSPSSSQVILAVEDLHGVQFDWPETKLENKLSLLEEAEFGETSALFRKLQHLIP